MKPLYSFAGRDSFIHRLDPRTKLVFIGCYLVASFFTPYPQVLFLVIIAIIWALGGISPAEYYPFLLFIAPLMAAITLVHTLFVGGPPYFAQVPLGPLTASCSLPGLAGGLEVAFRLATMGVAFIMFSMTTEPFQWGMAMHRSGLPYKVAFMFAFAMRFYPLLTEEFAIVQNATRARGSDALSSLNPLKFFRGAALAVVPLALGALRRSRDIALAMEARGFSFPEATGVRRVIYRDVRLRATDWAIILLSLAGLAALVAARTLGAAG